MIRRELLKIDGVKRVAFFGEREEQISISLPHTMLARNSVYPMQIMSEINALNKPVNAGHYYTADDEKLKLAIDGKIKSEADLREMIIQIPFARTLRSTSGGQVKLGDIAEITREYPEPQTEGFWVDGKPAIAVMVSMEPDAIVTQVGKRTDKRMKELMTSLPAGFEFDKVYFQPDRVSAAMSGFSWNVAASVLIVIITIMLTMGVRSGAIIGAVLIFTVLGTFPILLAMGGTLQRISLGAFVVAMGMLIDNSLVVMDGILVDKQRGLPPKQAYFRTVKNTAIPLLGATLIALITFLPVGISTDTIGEYASDLFYVLAISLLVSWVLALTQVPVFAIKTFPVRLTCASLAGEPRSAQKTGGDTWHSTGMQRFTGKTVAVLMKYKFATFIVSIMLLALSVAGFKLIKVKFFPDFDYNQLYVEYTLPPETSSERVKRDLLEITEKLSKYPEIEKIAVSQGRTPARYSLARAINSEGDYYVCLCTVQVWRTHTQFRRLSQGIPVSPRT